MKRANLVLSTLGLPLLPVYWLADPAIREDAARWVAINRTGRDAIDVPPGGWSDVLGMAVRYPEFRTLLYRRANRSTIGKVASRLAGLVYRGAPGLLVGSGPIGPGLYIEHGYCSVLAHSSLGRDVWINQGVTLAAHGERGGPVIGERVRIHAGAVVLGGVTVGDECVIGAGAIVSRDTPAGCVLAGPSAEVIKERRGDGVRVAT